MMLYPISEIFYSIQGEGLCSGTAAIFIRLAGCNLKCPWCDTNHKIQFTMTIDQIIDEIEKTAHYNFFNHSPMFVITGGEPTIHTLHPLLKRLQDRWSNCFIAIETNGTNLQCLKKLWVLDVLDWITWSPKPGVKYNLNDLSLLVNEIKVIYDGEVDPHMFDPARHGIEIDQDPYLLIQPCSENFEPAVKFVLENPKWVLSVQTQKIIKIK